MTGRSRSFARAPKVCLFFCTYCCRSFVRFTAVLPFLLIVVKHTNEYCMYFFPFVTVLQVEVASSCVKCCSFFIFLHCFVCVEGRRRRREGARGRCPAGRRPPRRAGAVASSRAPPPPPCNGHRGPSPSSGGSPPVLLTQICCLLRAGVRDQGDCGSVG